MKEINHKDDLKLLSQLCDSLDISDNNLRRDELNYWNIFGRKGSIFTDSKLWHVLVSCDSKRLWSATKSKLKFMMVSQDGDTEGIMKLERMPLPKEAAIVRKVLGLNKRPALTEEARAELVRRGNVLANKGVSSSQSDLNGKE